MKKGSVIVALVLVIAMVFTACQPGGKKAPTLNSIPERVYEPDKTIEFKDTYIMYGEERIDLGPKAIYLDGSLSNEDIDGKDYVYNSFNEVCKNLVSGTEADPMVVYIAPWVYWVHDPDSAKTTAAYQITINNIANLHLIGLSNNPKNAVICMNYGHNEGYDGGNPTMLNISGNCSGLTMKNITFGGYCNIDLDYPLNPELSREKRTDNITQCQLASYSGDKLYAENCRFVSRLNMMPFNSSKRALYVDCHFESTDDSLNGSSQAVYYNCDFEF
ncbi:MAG: hypothetical protein KBS81_05575, partial [Spirochaetales bacterium]|nr:hypothetical protein [Candidatus Physcosoma equi]